MRIDTLGVVMKEMVAKNMAICLCFSIGLCQAQYVFIPDPAMRDWLNTNIPGVVDGSGFMDTTYAGIAGFTNGTIDAFFPWDQQDLTGIQYLDGLITLEITTLNTDLYLPGFPMALEALTISGYGGTSLPPLPASLTHLNLDIAASLADLPALPSGLVSISLYYLDSLTTLPMLPVGLTSLRLETLPLLTSVPAFPTGLETLTINSTSLTMIPALPGGLNELNLFNMQSLAQLPAWAPSLTVIRLRQIPMISSFANLPVALDQFEMSWMPLATAVPSLPPGLTFLTIGGMPNLATWPMIPATLVVLGVNDLPFTTLPLLPSGLHYLSVSSMVGMELLPQLPLGLTALSASNMPDLVALPLLPGELTVLWLENVPNITALPVLPADLIELYMVDCDGVSCLPALPSGLALLTIYSATIDCLPAPLGPFVFPDLSFDPSTICTDPCITTTPLLGGRVFHDQNSNGLWDTGESPLQGAVITVLPGSLLASTNSSGQYLMAVPVGNYELSAASQTPYPQSVLPVVQSSLLLLTTDVDTTENFGIALEAGHHDLRAQIAATPSRPGFQNTVWASVTNHGTEPTGGDVTLGLDADQDWGYSSITPTSIAGNQVHWTMPPIAIGATWTVEVVLSTPIGTSIGTEIVHVLVVAADAVDEAPADDQALLTDVVVGSFDPNDKQVFPDEIELADLLVGQRVEYTIRFQNTGTAAASFVVVVDSLSSDLQWGTMRFESSSHPCSWEMRSGILRFRFDPIILPDSISDEPGSHGFVRFSMLPQPTLLPGYQVSNRADIYFDFNPPVATEPAIFNIIINTATSDVHQGAIMLHPIPAEDVLWVEVPMSDAMNWTMRILDMDGRVISTSEVTSGAKAVDVQDLRPGAYVLELSSSLQLLRTRFIKG